MKQTLLDRFIQLNPDFQRDLNNISKNPRDKFLRKLKKESQEENFRSIISELRFCQFLEKELLQYEYEPKLGLKRPDFLFKTSNLNAVYFDVKRFNISDFDRKNQSLLYEFCTKLKSINKPYYLDVDQMANELDFDIDDAFSKTKKWIQNNTITVGARYIYQDQLQIEVVNTNGIKDHVLFLYSGENPKIHVGKPKSDILTKVRTYQEVIVKKGIPFFVAIDLTFDTLKDPYDYWLQFLGGSCLDITNGYESFILGEFYANSELDGLVGLLIRYNYEFYWLNNPRNKVKLDFRNVKTEYET